MINTFLIDIPTMMLFGFLFTRFKEASGDSSVFKSRYFWHSLIFATLFNVAVVYAIIKYPDWMWMYYVENSHNTLPELIFIFIFLYYAPVVLGFYIGHDLAKRGLVSWLLGLVFLIASEAWIISHLFDRYSHIGTNAEFQNGTALSLFSPQNPIGPVMNGSVGLMVVYYLLVLWCYRKKSKNYIDSE